MTHCIVWWYGTEPTISLRYARDQPFCLTTPSSFLGFPGSSVQSDCLRPHEPQHTRPPCPSPTPEVHPNPCPLSRGCHPTISASVVPFSSHLQSFPASGSFPTSQFFCIKWPKYWSFSFNISPSNEHSGLISLQSKRLSRAFSYNKVQKHQFFSTHLSL